MNGSRLRELRESMKRIKKTSESLHPMEAADVEARFLEADFDQTTKFFKVYLNYLLAKTNFFKYALRKLFTINKFIDCTSIIQRNLKIKVF